MNFEDEEYVRVYTRKTITYKLLGWEGRTVLWHLMLEATQAGVVEIGDGDAVEAVTLLTELPVEVVSAGLSRLASRGVTERHGSSLVITRFVEAQTARRSERVRAAEYRGRVRAGLTNRVTERDENAAGVTERDAASRNVTAVTNRPESSLLSPSLSRSLSLSPSRSDLTAAADPRPVSLPRAPAPEAAAAAAAVIGQRLPGNLEDALRVPVCERAALVVSGRVAAQWVQPERWPEVVEVAAALAEGEGRQPLPLGRYDHDAGVRAVVELYAAGFVPSDVKRVARKVPTQAWWTAGDRKRGLANLSAEVMRRGLDDHPSDGGLLAAADRAREARLRRSEPESGPMPVADLVASFARGAS